MEKIAKLSLWLAVFFLFLRIGGSPETPNLKPSEFFVGISAVFTGAYMWKTKNCGWFAQKNKAALLWIGFFYMFLFFGSIASLILFRSLPAQFVAFEYMRLAVATALFLLVLFWGSLDKRFSATLVFAFLSSLIPSLFVPFPNIQLALNMVGGERFAGFMEDPNYYASFSLVAVSALFVAAMRARWKKPYALAGYIGALIILSSIWWSGSRSGWVGVSIGLLVALITLIRFSKKKLKTAATAVILCLLLIGGAFFILNDEQKTLTFSRTGYHYDFTWQGPGIQPRFLNALPGIIENQTERFAHGQDRLYLWKQAFAAFTKNPLGYGPGYYAIINLASAGEHRAAHSLLFEILLTAGIGGGILFALLLYLLARSWITAKNPDYLWIAAVSAFAGVLASSLFLDSLNLRWLWALGALYIVFSFSESTQRKSGKIR